MRAVYFIHIHRIYYCYYFDHITWNIYGGNFYPLFPNNQCVNLYFYPWALLSKCEYFYNVTARNVSLRTCLSNIWIWLAFALEWNVYFVMWYICLFRDVVWCDSGLRIIYISHQMQMSTSHIFFILGCLAIFSKCEYFYNITARNVSLCTWFSNIKI